MAIIPVKEIPKPNINKSGPISEESPRPQLYEDIKSAFMCGVAKFEIVGYKNKPDYIGQVARSVAFDICQELIFAQAKAYATEILTKEFPQDCKVYVPVPRWHNIIEIHGVTLHDGQKHVYCEIHYDRAVAYKDKLLEKAREATKSRYDKETRMKEREAYSVPC